MHHDRNAWIGLDLVALARVVVGVKTDVARLDHDLFAEHDAGGGLPAVADTRDDHRVGIRLVTTAAGQFQPLVGGGQGVGGQRIG